MKASAPPPVGAGVSAGRRGVWITRAEPGAGTTAEAVRRLGFEPVVSPLLDVRFLRPDLDLTGVGALAFTSANGVRAFSALTDDRSLPAFAVGDATADVARAAGFARVTSADGDALALARLVIERPPAGHVLHPTAREPAADLVGALRAAGIAARTLAVYETLEAERLTDEVLRALHEQTLLAVLIHSPRAGVCLEHKLRDAGIAAGRLPEVLGLSPACLAPLAGHAVRTRAPAHPRERDLLALLAPAPSPALGKPPAPR